MLDINFFIKIGANVRDRYRNYIFFKTRKDVFGRNYKGYSASYRKAKKKGDLKRQASQYKDYNSPVLSGDLANDLTLKNVTKNGFQLVFPIQGAKVKWLRDMGRTISDPEQPMPSEVINYLSDKARRYMITKRPQRKKTYRIGK
jgi:hypothetical protein